jgi:uncharacterized protein
MMTDHSSETEHPYQVASTKSWIRTASGKPFDLLTPRAADVRVSDIAYALSKLCRFTGQYPSDDLYSVAEHCWHVSFRSEELVIKNRPLDETPEPCLLKTAKAARWGLVHDWAEAYCADLNSPLKSAPGLEAYKKIEHGVLSAIAERLGLGELSTCPPEVDVADNELYWTERLKVHGLSGPEETTKSYVEPLKSVKIRMWDPRTARWFLLERFKQLFPDYKE